MRDIIKYITSLKVYNLLRKIFPDAIIKIETSAESLSGIRGWIEGNEILLIIEINERYYAMEIEIIEVSLHRSPAHCYTEWPSRTGTDCGIGHACYMNKLSSCRRVT